MAKKKQEPTGVKKLMHDMDDDVKYWALIILFFVLSIFFLLSPFGVAGVVGDSVFKWLKAFFGLGYYIIPALLILLSVSFMKREHTQLPSTTTVGSAVFFLSGLALLSVIGGVDADYGGYIGSLISAPLLWLFEKTISLIFLFALFVISLFFIYNTVPSKETLFFWRRFKKDKDEVEITEDHPVIHAGNEVIDPEEEETEEGAPEEVEEPQEEKKSKKDVIKDIFTIGEGQKPSFTDLFAAHSEFTPPPLKLLSGDKGKPGVGDIKANTNIIKRTLANFGINVEMDEVSVGPTVTRYAFKPAEGVKLTRIITLKDDLALALAAHPIRIEAPIPGKSLVGIEIPNTTKTTVGLASLFKAREYLESPKPLLMALGRGISGKEYFADLAKTPHMLIAGSTGSGKSVTIHTLINSMLFRNPPENLRLIMVDPKRVELTLYDGIPHLLNPVITDAKKAIRALQWAGKEMERRYDILKGHKVRDILSYHENIYTPATEAFKKQYGDNLESEEALDAADELPERMPYIVFIIDELADIMTTYPKELEAGIVRLAQMSRAIGIHLILSTQRPSVNVITGLIKANVPARLALKVASQIDSRTILDQGGAEALLGQGDMLYLGGEMSKPQRIQSAYISEKELKSVVDYIIKDYADMLPDEISLEEGSQNALFSQELTTSLDVEESDTDLDDKYEEARLVVIETQKASTSFLQRKMGLGYSRAAKIVDQLEENGVIGPQQGSKSRQVYIQTPSDENGEDDQLENHEA